MGAQRTLLTEIAEYRKRLERELGRVETVLLFGSQAHGKAGTDSDVDLIIVSPAFVGKTFLQRAWLARDHWNLPYPVDMLCYTPDEFKTLRNQVSIVSVALREGVEITG